MGVETSLKKQQQKKKTYATGHRAPEEDKKSCSIEGNNKISKYPQATVLHIKGVSQ